MARPISDLEKLKGIEDIVGPLELNCFFTYAGMDYDYVKTGMTLFAEKVLPALKKWQYTGNAA